MSFRKHFIVVKLRKMTGEIPREWDTIEGHSYCGVIETLLDGGMGGAVSRLV